MPLKKGKSNKIFSENVSELLTSFKKKGKIGTSTPSSSDAARKQALAIAFSVKRKNRR